MRIPTSMRSRSRRTWAARLMRYPGRAHGSRRRRRRTGAMFCAGSQRHGGLRRGQSGLRRWRRQRGVGSGSGIFEGVHACWRNCRETAKHVWRYGTCSRSPTCDRSWSGIGSSLGQIHTRGCEAEVDGLRKAAHRTGAGNQRWYLAMGAWKTFPWTLLYAIDCVVLPCLSEQILLPRII
ncbi:hypothetical protein DFJ74DRAFT_687482 [Hyaloraphidium curvatum]|nr:hypothetical protein DFJ74DRAFT_687482 [Hyaloraphidium curvatum]